MKNVLKKVKSQFGKIYRLRDRYTHFIFNLVIILILSGGFIWYKWNRFDNIDIIFVFIVIGILLCILFICIFFYYHITIELFEKIKFWKLILIQILSFNLIHLVMIHKFETIISAQTEFMKSLFFVFNGTCILILLFYNQLLIKKSLISIKISIKMKKDLSSYKEVKSIFCIILFITYIYLVKIDSSFIISFSISILILWLLLFLFNFPYDMDSLKDSVGIHFLNLNMKDICDSKIYLNESNLKFKAYRIFKIDLDKFFPKDVLNKEVKIVNQPYVYTKESKRIFEKRPYCYLVINDDSFSGLAKLQILLIYQDTKDMRVRKSLLNLYIKYVNIKGEIIVVNKYVESYKKVLFLSMNKDFSYWGKEKFNFKKVYEKSYQYPDNLDLFQNELLSKEVTENRKWVHHEGGYGVGKTSLDILTVSNTGFKPVVISPWAENYDQDILSLIFKNVAENSNTLFYFPDRSVTMFYFLELVTLVPVFYIILTYLKTHLISIFFTDFLQNFNQYSDYGPFFIGCISVILGIMTASIFLPHLILLRNNSTKLYQTFYLKEIRKTLSREKMVLIVEDVDRLNENALEDTVRTLSTLNDICYHVKRIIGIVSYSKNNIASLFNEGRHNDILKDIENKIIYEDIFKGYSNEETMRTYLKDSISVIVYQNNKEEDQFNDYLELQQIINTMLLKNYNLRDIHKWLEKFVVQDELNEQQIIRLLKAEFKEDKKSLYVRIKNKLHN